MKQFTKLLVVRWDEGRVMFYDLETISLISHDDVDFDGEVKHAFIIHFMDKTTATFIADNSTIEFN